MTYEKLKESLIITVFNLYQLKRGRSFVGLILKPSLRQAESREFPRVILISYWC
jgi:hypothetical protein